MDKKLGKNIIMSMGYNILTIIVPFITAPYLARTLGATKVGSYTYVQSIAAYFVMFGLLGMRNYGNRTIARVRDDKDERSKVFWQVFAMQFLTGAISSVAYVAYLILFCHTHKLLAFIVGMYVLTAIFTVDWFCEGMEQFSSMAIRTLSIKLLNLVAIFTLVHTENDVVVYCFIMSGLNLVSSLLLWPSVVKYTDFVMPKLEDVLVHFKPNLLLFVPAIASSIYQTMDKIMIGSIASEAELAYYEYADKIVQIPNLLFTAMGAVMLSRMSHVFQHDEEAAEHTIGLSMDLAFLISAACGFGILGVSDELVAVYYGQSFMKSAPILMALTPTVLMYGWANVIRMQYVIPNNMDSVYIKSTFAGALVNLVCNLIFIAKYQAVGATIGTLAAQFTVALVFTISVYKYLPLKKYALRNLPIIGIGTVMMLIIWEFQKIHQTSLVGLLVDVCVGGFVYVVMIMIYGRFSKNNLASNLVGVLLKKARGK